MKVKFPCHSFFDTFINPGNSTIPHTASFCCYWALEIVVQLSTSFFMQAYIMVVQQNVGHRSQNIGHVRMSDNFSVSLHVILCIHQTAFQSLILITGGISGTKNSPRRKSQN